MPQLADDFREYRKAQRFAHSLDIELQEAPQGHPEAGTYRLWDIYARHVAAARRGAEYGLSISEVRAWLDEEARS